jgi:hypothetical protein
MAAELAGTFPSPRFENSYPGDEPPKSTPPELKEPKRELIDYPKGTVPY